MYRFYRAACNANAV